VIKEAKALYMPLATFVASMLVWYVCAVEFGWGEAEAQHDPESIWQYVRKFWMISLAFSLPMLAGWHGIRCYGWRITLPWLLIAVAIGLAQGNFNSGGYQMGVVAVLGAGYHSFAVEVYFRAYMIRAFSRALNGFWPPVLLSSLMYGLYHLSVYPAMQENPFVFYVPFFTVLGILFGYIYQKSQSLLATWFCHWIAVLPVIPALTSS
jgi:membrane protease YdiL (CAAX protease family)